MARIYSCLEARQRRAEPSSWLCGISAIRCASSVPAEGRVTTNAADAKEAPAKQKGAQRNLLKREMRSAGLKHLLIACQSQQEGFLRPRTLLNRCLLAGVPLPDDNDAPGEIKAGTATVEETKTKAKSKNSRARRLSYVANAEGVGPQV